MADVSVEFGAQDVGLEKTLKAVQAQMADLKSNITETGVTGEDLEKTMRKMAQLEGFEKRLKSMATEASGLTGELAKATPKIEDIGGEIKKLEEKINGGNLSITEMKTAVADLSSLKRLEKQVLDVRSEFQKVEEPVKQFQNVIYGTGDIAMTTEKRLASIGNELTELREHAKTATLTSEQLENTMKRIGQLEATEKKLKAMGDEAKGTSPKVDELGKDLEKMGNRGNDAGEKSSMSLGKIGLAAGVAGVAVKAGMLAVDAAFAAVNGTINAFGSAITKAADFQQLETSFNVLIGNTTLAKTFLDDLSKFAASTPFTIPGLADASKTLISFGVVSSDVIPIVSMLGDVAQGNEEKLKSLALAFGKVESQGKLTGEELNQMIDSGFNPLEDISVKTGKSMGELRKEMEKGAITSGMVRDAFTAATSEGGKFFGMTEKQGLTFNGVMSTMQDAVDDLYRRFGRPLIDALTPIIQKWSERISSIAPLFSEIGQAVANTVTFFSNLVDKAFNVDNAVKNISKSLSAISGGEYSSGIENLFLSMKVWAMESGNEIFKRLAASFQTATEFAKSIFDPSGAFGKTIIDSFEYIGTKASVSIMRTLAKGFSGSVITEGIALSLNTAANEANISANKIEESFKGAGSKIAEQFYKAGKALPESFAKNYADVQPLFTDIKATQDQIDANNAKIAASTKEITKSESETVAEAKAYFQEYQKGLAFKEKDAAASEEKLKKDRQANDLKQKELAFELQLAAASEKAIDNARDSSAKAEASWSKILGSAYKAEKSTLAAEAALTRGAREMSQADFSKGFKEAQQNLKDLGGDYKKLANSGAGIKTIASSLGLDTEDKSTKRLLLEVQQEIEKIGKQEITIGYKFNSALFAASVTSLYDTANATFANPVPLNLNGDQSIAAVRTSAEGNFASPIAFNLDGDRTIQDVRDAAETNFANPIALTMSGSQAANDVYSTVNSAFDAPVTVGVNADTSTAQTDVGSLGTPITLALNADTSNAQTQVASLGTPITFKLDADTAPAAAKVATLSDPISVQIDSNQVQAAVASMQADISNSFTGGVGGTGGSGGTGGQGGQGGAGGDAKADVSSITTILNDWTDIILTIRDRLPIMALSPA
jgi:tape measure domain-containing protein